MSKVSSGYFDGLEIELESADDVGSEVDYGSAEAKAALAAWSALTAADREADTRHLHAYYLDLVEETGEGDPEVEPVSLWGGVEPGAVHLTTNSDPDGHVYLVLEAECGWEEEHGVMMVWRDGGTLIKLGEFDGHATNVDAYDDPSLEGVVYASDERTTRIA